MEEKRREKEHKKRRKTQERERVRKTQYIEGVLFLHSGVIVRKDERKKTRRRGSFAAKP